VERTKFSQNRIGYGSGYGWLFSQIWWIEAYNFRIKVDPLNLVVIVKSNFGKKNLKLDARIFGPGSSTWFLYHTELLRGNDFENRKNCKSFQKS
jgi:hypothetical protein